MTVLEVARPGILMTVQDGGRWGWAHWGIMVHGALDDYARHWANWLVGNAEDDPVIEVTAGGGELLIREPGRLGLAGADLGAHLDGVPWPPGSARWVAKDQRLSFQRRRRGLRAYLALPGGVDVPRVLGSAATDLTARVGGWQGRRLEVGDVLGARGDGGQTRATEWPTMRRSHVLRVLPGVRLDRFPPHALTQLLTRMFRVSPESSAIGLRLVGEPVASPRGDWPSEGMAIGSVECPPDGQLLLLLKGRGSLGGYPALAHVIRADWPSLGQLAPGDWVAFNLVTVEEARLAWHAYASSLGRTTMDRKTLTAPVDGVVTMVDEYGRRLPEDGDWVGAGQLLMRIHSLGCDLPIFAPSEGEVAFLVTEGQVVEAGRAIIELRGEGYDSVH
ncbi:MAG: urea amidolyase [Firmicutes bacterium]|nr:urea amidolyase [Bacillota bacterium]